MREYSIAAIPADGIGPEVIAAGTTVLFNAVFAKFTRQGTLSLILGASAAIGASYFGMGIAGSLPVACALAVLGGLGNGMQWVAAGYTHKADSSVLPYYIRFSH